MAQYMEMFRDQQETLLRGVLQGLLAQVAQDYNLDHQELVKKYLVPPGQAQVKDGDGIPAPLLVAVQQEKTRKRASRAKPEKVCCQGTTAKGQPCKFAALEGGYCKKHTPGAETATKTPSKPRKVQKPRHNHLVEEEPTETCQVCEDHGNVTRPESTREEFRVEGEEALAQRLRAIMAEAEETPEETTEETTDMVSVNELMDEKKDNTPYGSEHEEDLEEPDEDMAARLRSILSEESDDEKDEN